MSLQLRKITAQNLHTNHMQKQDCNGIDGSNSSKQNIKSLDRCNIDELKDKFQNGLYSVEEFKSELEKLGAVNIQYIIQFGGANGKQLVNFRFELNGEKYSIESDNIKKTLPNLLNQKKVENNILPPKNEIITQLLGTKIKLHEGTQYTFESLIAEGFTENEIAKYFKKVSRQCNQNERTMSPDNSIIFYHLDNNCRVNGKTIYSVDELFEILHGEQ